MHINLCFLCGIVKVCQKPDVALLNAPFLGAFLGTSLEDLQLVTGPDK